MSKSRKILLAVAVVAIVGLLAYAFVSGNNLVGTWWSLMPPVIAIGLALITKEVYMSLFIGILSGALLYANFAPVATTEAIFEVMISKLGEARIMDNCKVWNDGNEFGE